MKKTLLVVTTLVCIFGTATYTYAQIKTDYASTTVDERGIDRGQEEAVKYTTDIKNYAPEIIEEKNKEIGFWTILFYIVIFILATFVAR